MEQKRQKTEVQHAAHPDSLRGTHLKKKQNKKDRNMIEREIRPAPSWLKASIWTHFAFYKVDWKWTGQRPRYM